jgi:hypothetical protein
MKKLLTYLALLPLIILSLFPPIEVGFKVPPSSFMYLWVWVVLLAMFAGLVVLFLKVNVFVKVISVLTLLSCFLTSAPLISQYAYIEVVLCIYYYILCTKIKDWEIVKKSLWIILGINLLLLFLQNIHRDSLLNYGILGRTCIGVVGNNMQFKSFILVIVSMILVLSKVRKYKWIILGTVALFIIYFFKHGVAKEFAMVRGPAWSESLRVSFMHPFIGWGIGSFKVIFYHLVSKGSYIAEGRWLTTHNDFLQILFEVGFIGFGVVIAYMINLIRRVRGILLFALGLVIFDMLVYFPMRQITCVPILIMFFAYYEQKLKGEVL